MVKVNDDNSNGDNYHTLTIIPATVVRTSHRLSLTLSHAYYYTSYHGENVTSIISYMDYLFSFLIKTQFYHYCINGEVAA